MYTNIGEAKRNGKPFVTISDKILIHLSRFDTIRDNQLMVPFDITQDGIAGCIGISRAHVCVEIKRLETNGLVKKWKAHVMGSQMKRLVYQLSQRGLEVAQHLVGILESEGVIIDTLFDIKRCNPGVLWESLNEEDREIMGKACILRTPIPRNHLPKTKLGTVPIDKTGMVLIQPGIAKNYVSYASAQNIRNWNSWAADYWKSQKNYSEELFHLVNANRIDDALECIQEHEGELLSSPSSELMRTINKIIANPKKSDQIYLFGCKVALALREYDAALRIAQKLASVNGEGWKGILGEVYYRRGETTAALGYLTNQVAENRDIKSAAIASDIYSQNNDVNNAERYVRIAADSIQKTGDYSNINLVYIAMSKVCKLKGDYQKAAEMEQAQKRTVPSEIYAITRPELGW